MVQERLRDKSGPKVYETYNVGNSDDEGARKYYRLNFEAAKGPMWNSIMSSSTLPEDSRPCRDRHRPQTVANPVTSVY